MIKIVCTQLHVDSRDQMKFSGLQEYWSIKIKLEFNYDDLSCSSPCCRVLYYVILIVFLICVSNGVIWLLSYTVSLSNIFMLK